MITTLPFSNKNILIIGGTHGIGFATSEAFAQQGASRVCICSRKQTSIDHALQQLKMKYPSCLFEGFTANVSDKEQMLQGLFETLQTKEFDVLVSNVGVDPVSGKVLDMDEKVYDKIFNTNVKSTWWLIKTILPLMRGRQRQLNSNNENDKKQFTPSIILVSSTGGYQPSFPSGLYGVSKLALISLTKALASELQDSVRINCVAPGLVKTRMSEAFWKSSYGPIAEKTLFTKRLGEPDDIADVICFLASHNSRWITGETIVVSGGTFTRL
jgi:dehydrogenase/reductase SDR family protein 4